MNGALRICDDFADGWLIHDYGGTAAQMKVRAITGVPEHFRLIRDLSII